MGTVQNSETTLAPENLTIANNIMLNSDISAFQEVTVPTGTSIYEGNITQNGSWDLTNGVNSNQTVSSGLLISGSDFYRLVVGSPAIDAGVGNYSFLTKDILGGDRAVDFDAGAEEFEASGTLGPYDLSDVGQTLGFGALNSLSIGDNIINEKGIKIYPIPSSDELIILSNSGEIGTVNIFDVFGKLVFKTNVELNKTRIDISNFSSGVYILKTEKYTNRFVVE